MKTPVSDLRSSSSVWQLLQAIDRTMGQALPLAEQLEKTAEALIEALEVDAVWLLTIQPLAPLAFGMMRTHLTVAPDAKVRVLDRAPPSADRWSDPDTLVGKVISRRSPHFIESDQAETARADSDLGDALFNVFEAIPAAVIPLVADDTPLGVLIVGNKPPVRAKFSQETRDFLAYLGQHLAKNLLNAYLAGNSRRHSDTLVTLNQIARTITSSLDIDDVIETTMAGINKILDVEAGSLLLVDQVTDWFTAFGRPSNRRTLFQNYAAGGKQTGHNLPAIMG
jgi:GAF domain-containing protein